MKVQSLLLYNDWWHSYTFPKDFQGKSEKYRYIQSESEITLFPDDLDVIGKEQFHSSLSYDNTLP